MSGPRCEPPGPNLKDLARTIDGYPATFQMGTVSHVESGIDDAVVTQVEEVDMDPLGRPIPSTGLHRRPSWTALRPALSQIAVTHSFLDPAQDIESTAPDP